MSLQRGAWNRWESPNSNPGLIPKPIRSLSVQIYNLCYPNFMVHDMKTSKRIIWLQLLPHKTLLRLLSHIGRCLKETMARQMQESDSVFSWGLCGPGECGMCVGSGARSDSQMRKPLSELGQDTFLYWNFVDQAISFIYKVHWLHSLGTGETSRWKHLEMRGNLWDIDSWHAFQYMEGVPCLSL